VDAGALSEFLGRSHVLNTANRSPDSPDGIELTGDLKKIHEVRRDVGMVFQQFNLFPHHTILDNCTLAPIWVKKLSRRETLPCTTSAASGFPSKRISTRFSCQAASSSVRRSRDPCA